MTPPPTTTGRANGDESTLNPHSRSAASRRPLADARTRSAKSLPIFLCYPRGQAFFFAKKDPPGINSKVGGGSLKKERKRPHEISQRFYARFGQNVFWGGELKRGGNSECITAGCTFDGAVAGKSKAAFWDGLMGLPSGLVTQVGLILVYVGIVGYFL